LSERLLTTQTLPDHSAIGAITPGFQHINKLVTAEADHSLPAAYLKRYDIRRHDVDMPPGLARESREFLRAEVEAGRLFINHQVGFVDLHHCTTSLFLLVFTWNNDNEPWAMHHTKSLQDAGSIQRFEASNGDHHAMNCVWELAPIWHKRQDWVRYLRSERDDAAKRACLADRYVGDC
jgi:hypothetical protein